MMERKTQEKRIPAKKSLPGRKKLRKRTAIWEGGGERSQRNGNGKDEKGGEEKEMKIERPE